MNIYIALIISAMTFFSFTSINVDAYGQLIGMGEKARSESSKVHGNVGHEKKATHVDVHRNTGVNPGQRHNTGEDAAYQRGVQNADAGASSSPVYVVPENPPVTPVTPVTPHS